MKPFLILLILSGFIHYNMVYCQDQSEIIRLRSILDTVSRYTAKIDIHAQLAWEYTNANNDSALLHSDTMLKLALANNYSLGEVLAYESIGLHHEIVYGDFEKASNYYFKGIEICNEHGLDYEMSLYHNLGVLFHTSDNYDKALEYYQITLALATDNQDDNMIKKCLTNIGSIKSSMGDFKAAEENMLSSLEIKVNSAMDFSTYANLGNLYIRQEKYDKALPFVLKAVEQHPDNQFSEANLYFLLQLKAFTKDTLGMKPYVSRAIKEIDKAGLRDKSLLLRYLGDYYKATGDLGNALQYKDRFIDVNEEIVLNQRDAIVLELETKYRTERKDREIAQQALEIKTKENQKAQLVGGITALLLLLVISGIFFWKRLVYQKEISLKTEELQRQKITDLQQRNKLLALNSMIEGQEAERLRIAKDLHDSLGGLLSTVKAHFAIIQDEIQQPESLNISEKTGALIDEACVEVRRISHNMVPQALGLSGIGGAIEDIAGQLERQGYEVDLRIEGLPEQIDPTREATVYRLVQEIVSNFRKHAQATSVMIQLLGYQGSFTLIVEDNGIGFNYEVALERGGMGLKSINSRVQFLDGTIDWDTEPERGTTITINIPPR